MVGVSEGIVGGGRGKGGMGRIIYYTILTILQYKLYTTILTTLLYTTIQTMHCVIYFYVVVYDVQ